VKPSPRYGLVLVLRAETLSLIIESLSEGAPECVSICLGVSEPRSLSKYQ
jgi:hypothetical protein